LLFGKNKTIAKIRNLKDHQHAITGNRMPALMHAKLEKIN